LASGLVVPAPALAAPGVLASGGTVMLTSGQTALGQAPGAARVLAAGGNGIAASGLAAPARAPAAPGGLAGGGAGTAASGRGAPPRAMDAGAQRPRRPDLPEGITAAQLDPAARAQLRTLPGDLADAVARWLVAAGQEEDPERAYEYAQHARTLAARVGVVRETTGITAYRAGRWAEALTELRTARRLTGDPSYLPMMA